MNNQNTWKNLYTIGGIAALLQLGIVLLIIIVTATLGTRPVEVQEFFEMYQNNKLAGFLQDDFSSLFLMMLYLFTFPALYYALRRVNPVYTTLATLLTLAVVISCIATHSGFSLMYLSDKYAAAAGEAQRAQILAAGEAVLASDIWNSSSAFLSGILMQGSGVLISLVILRSKDFSRVTAWSGLLANSFDLIQHLLHPFAPEISSFIFMFFGSVYLIWFPMLARDLLRLAKNGLQEPAVAADLSV